MNCSLEERLRHDAESREEMRAFYENQMENLRKEQRVALAKLQEQHWWQIESFFKWIKGNLTITEVSKVVEVSILSKADI